MRTAARAAPLPTPFSPASVVYVDLPTIGQRSLLAA
eukprot:gene45723-66_t